jgi:hypothetical protein
MGMKTTGPALLGVLLLIAPGLGQAAKVYKWTDNQGNVIYSDSPRPGAQEIEVPTEPAGIVPVPPQQIPRPKPPTPGSVYGTLIVASPSNDQIIDDPGGWVNVSLALEPPLRVSQGDAIRLKLDGQTLVTRYTGSEIALSNVARGTHTLQAEVVDPAGNALIGSQSVTFHVQQPSIQAPAGPPPGDQPPMYPRTYPPQPYPPTYTPVYPPQPYPPQGQPKPNLPPTPQPK